MSRINIKFQLHQFSTAHKLKLPGGFLDRVADQVLAAGGDPVAVFTAQAIAAGIMRAPKPRKQRAPRRRTYAPPRKVAPFYPYGGARALVAAGKAWAMDQDPAHEDEYGDGQSAAVDIAQCVTGWPYGSVELSCAADDVYAGICKVFAKRSK